MKSAILSLKKGFTRFSISGAIIVVATAALTHPNEAVAAGGGRAVERPTETSAAKRANEEKIEANRRAIVPPSAGQAMSAANAALSLASAANGLRGQAMADRTCLAACQTSFRILQQIAQGKVTGLSKLAVQNGERLILGISSQVQSIQARTRNSVVPVSDLLTKSLSPLRMTPEQFAERCARLAI